VDEAASVAEATEDEASLTADEAPLAAELIAELTAEVASLATDEAAEATAEVSCRRWRGPALTAPTAARAAIARLESIVVVLG
jgi:hypothetical protein